MDVKSMKQAVDASMLKAKSGIQNAADPLGLGPFAAESSRELGDFFGAGAIGTGAQQAVGHMDRIQNEHVQKVNTVRKDIERFGKMNRMTDEQKKIVQKLLNAKDKIVARAGKYVDPEYEIKFAGRPPMGTDPSLRRGLTFGELLEKLDAAAEKHIPNIKKALERASLPKPGPFGSMGGLDVISLIPGVTSVLDQAVKHPLQPDAGQPDA